MARQEQVVILAIAYDDEEADPPETWNYAELLECAEDDVKVILTGVLTEGD